MPFAARRKGILASADVTFNIKPNGRTSDIRVEPVQFALEENRVHEAAFQSSISRALRRWRYFAYMNDGEEMGREDVRLNFFFSDQVAGEEELTREESCTTSFSPEPPSHAGDPANPLVNLQLCMAPNITEEADKAKQSGKVTVAFNVSEEGKVVDANVKDGNAEDPFTKKAIDAVNLWQYQPFLITGTPTARKNLAVQISYGEKPESLERANCLHADFGTSNKLPPVKAIANRASCKPKKGQRRSVYVRCQPGAVGSIAGQERGERGIPGGD